MTQDEVDISLKYSGRNTGRRKGGEGERASETQAERKEGGKKK